MATIRPSNLFSELRDWPGRLLEGDDTTTVVARGGGTFTLRHGAGSPFEGFRIEAKGTGFAYLDGVPVAGTMTQLLIFDAEGRVVLAGSKLSGELVTDLALFADSILGSPSEEAGPGPDGGTAWSLLLSQNDKVVGTEGDDRRYLPGFNAGDDTFDMRGGDDQMSGGIGDDAYFGGEGYDELSFGETAFNWGAPATRGATIDVEAGTVLDPWGGTDRFEGIEQFQGSRFQDTFRGSPTEDDRFGGLRGRDVIDGGDVTFRDGEQTEDDRDRASYGDDYWQGGRFGIVADLETSVSGGSIRGTIRDGFGQVDTVSDIERVVGTRFRDSFVGSSVDNQFRGGEGRDTYDGQGGQDMLNFDDWFADEEPGGIRVDLALASGQIVDDGFGNTETALSIEEIKGTARADSIAGNASDNYFEGAGGADTMRGRGGSDTFSWIEQEELGEGDRITDFAATGSQADRLAFETENFENMTGTLRLVNGTAATTTAGTFLFVNATDQLIWDSNGTGAGGREVVVVLTGVSALSAANFDLWV